MAVIIVYVDLFFPISGNMDIDYEQVWRSIPEVEKAQLISFYLKSEEKPWKNERKYWLLELPPELLKMITTYFARDPHSFLNLSLTCKTMKEKVGDFKDVADKTCLTLYVTRLIRRVNKKLDTFDSGRYLRILFHKTYDEKCRYIDLQDAYKADLKAASTIVCKIDKANGMILSSDMKPRGYIYEETPEVYFGEYGLLYIKNVESEVPTFTKQKRDEMEKEHKKITEELKKTKSYLRKRKFAAVWDESTMRKKAFYQA